MKKYIGIDVGGTTIKHGLLTDEGEILSKNKLKTPLEKNQFLNTIVDIVTQYRSQDKIEACGISMPGVIEGDGFLTTAGALKNLYGINLIKALQKDVALPITVINDANAAALAEHWIGAAKAYQTYFGLVLGTGVGGGIIINGDIYNGAHSRAGEFGWMIAEPNEENLEFGTLNFQGATVIGLLRVYNEALSHQNDEIKSPVVVDNPRLIFRRAAGGDAIATRVLDHYFYILAKEIFNLIVAFDPEAVIIGGGISNNEDFYKGLQAKIKQLHQQHDSVRPIQLPPVLLAQLRNDAGLIGAVYHAKTHH